LGDEIEVVRRRRCRCIVEEDDEEVAVQHRREQFKITVVEYYGPESESCQDPVNPCPAAHRPIVSDNRTFTRWSWFGDDTILAE
jgi:hypothetical protein